MIVHGQLRGYPCAVRLTWRESEPFRRAQQSGFLVTGTRVGMVEHAWEAACTAEQTPQLVIHSGRRTASVVLDLSLARVHLDEIGVREVKRLLFRAGSQAPNPASRGRLRRVVVLPTYAYARVPVHIAEAVARMLLRIVRQHAKPVQKRRTTPTA